MSLKCVPLPAEEQQCKLKVKQIRIIRGIYAEVMYIYVEVFNVSSQFSPIFKPRE